MVCASMTEASSARWAKNKVKTIQDRLRKTSVAILAKAHAVSDGPDPGCGDTCDQEFMQAYVYCTPGDLPPADVNAWIACMDEFFDADCYDCLCNYIYANT